MIGILTSLFPASAVASSPVQTKPRLSLAGGEATRVTEYPLDVGSLEVSPQGDRIALSMEVLPECADLRCTQDKLAARAKNKATGCGGARRDRDRDRLRGYSLSCDCLRNR